MSSSLSSTSPPVSEVGNSHMVGHLPFGAFRASHDLARLGIFNQPGRLRHFKESNREDFVKLGKTLVRVPRIIQGGECFL
jgi:hypothetical protein